jgi:hypothetical protein
VPAILAVAGVESSDTYNGWKGANMCPPSLLWLGWRAQILTMVGKGRIGALHLGCGWGGGLTNVKPSMSNGSGLSPIRSLKYVITHKVEEIPKFEIEIKYTCYNIVIHIPAI